MVKPPGLGTRLPEFEVVDVRSQGLSISFSETGIVSPT